jgi:2-dehydropantoate 2-reductase
MRFVIYGAGAVGGVIGGRLKEHGRDVVLIGRGKQVAAIRENGLRVESPGGSTTVHLPIVEHPNQLVWSDSDVVLLTMKTQDTSDALRDLVTSAPTGVPVVCTQNGVENERLALRWFEHVYGICVMCPAGYLTPGVVQAWSSPVSGLLDIGRYPSGIDETAKAIAAALSTSTFHSEVRPDIMRWKYGKLLMNLGNAIEAVSGSPARSGPIPALARQEGVACLSAAGIDFVSESEDKSRRGDLLKISPIAGQSRQGGSSWQSLFRKTHHIESDYLNGEIVLLGRIHDVPTPVNAVLQRLANQLAASGRPPGSMSNEELLSHFPPNLRKVSL